MSLKNVFTIAPIPPQDLQRAYRFRVVHVGQKSFQETKKQYAKTPSLFIGCYRGRKIIGICFPTRGEGEGIGIEAIGVDPRHRRKKLGTKMMDAFITEAKRKGLKRASVGSAEGYVERFYQKNKFKPVSLFLRIPKEDIPPAYVRLGYKIMRVRKQKGYLMFNIPTNSYSQMLKRKLQRVFHAEDIHYIFEKKI
jgi:GNAT superfamily N-acetyltransferase